MIAEVKYFKIDRLYRNDFGKDLYLYPTSIISICDSEIEMDAYLVYKNSRKFCESMVVTIKVEDLKYWHQVNRYIEEDT